MIPIPLNVSAGDQPSDPFPERHPAEHEPDADFGDAPSAEHEDAGAPPAEPSAPPAEPSAPPAESSDPSAEEPFPAERAGPPPSEPVGLVPVRTEAPPASRPFSMRRVVLGFVILVVLGLGSLWLLDSFSEQHVSGDLIQFAGRAQSAITQFQEATDEETVRDQLLRRLGWRVRIPEIRNTPLTGVGFAEVMTGISVPVLVYEEPSGGELAVTIVNYVFLDTHEGVLRFEPEALRGIEDEGTFVVRKSRDRDVLIWRVGDEIYLASGEESGEDLARRIAQAQSGR